VSVARRYWIETLGCPKNEVDSAKLAGTLTAEGFGVATAPELADLVVVNTCAFIEAARQESIDTVLALDRSRREGSRLVVTGCLAERYGDELEDALPEVDLVAPFGVSLTASRPEHGGALRPSVALASAPGPAPAPAPAAAPAPVTLGRKPAGPRTMGDRPVSDFDLLNLPRPPSTAPWAYVKVAEGCDRHCGFCAIPSFRGRQRSRTTESIFAEVDSLATSGQLQEIVLVAQDLASFGLDRWPAASLPDALPTDAARSEADSRRARGRLQRRPIVDLVKEVAERVEWVRLLYLYPSRLDEELVETIVATGVPYFDLSLQHVSRPLLAGMRRPGNGDRFLDRIRSIRAVAPGAAFRSSFIIGYPGETEDDHDLLLDWLDEACLDWVGFFPFSREEGTPAAQDEGQVPAELVAERLRECSERQDAITAARRDDLIGEEVRVLVVAPGEGRTYREAPEIDGIVRVPDDLEVGSFADLVVTGAAGPDLEASRSVAPCGLR
jgi:ribosomal protein S12 methylthiotransferase